MALQGFGKKCWTLFSLSLARFLRDAFAKLLMKRKRVNWVIKNLTTRTSHFFTFQFKLQE